MIRRTQFNINYCNKNKLNTLDVIFEESKRVVNLYIDKLWIEENFSSKFISFKVKTWLSARLQQCLGKQALEIVKSQRKRKKKTKPILKQNSINLDSRFITISFNINTFDVWFKLASIGRKIKINIPSRKHKHFINLIDKGFSLRKSARLRKTNKGKYYIDLYCEKENPDKKKHGRDIGIDIGYKKLIACSDKKTYGKELKEIYIKISRKKQGSKSFKRSLIERNNKINEVINKISFVDVKTIVVEDLKNVKRRSKGKIIKKFNNKLQRWSYPKVLNKLASVCAETGIAFIKVDPSYTSQTCNLCGVINKSNRKGEIYQCACGLKMDADINASINILHRGVYSPPVLQHKWNILPLNV